MSDLIHKIRSRPEFLLLSLNIPTHPAQGNEVMLGRGLWQRSSGRQINLFSIAP